MTLFARGALAGAILAAPAALGAPSFVVTDTSVRQGRFEAVARTREMIVSSYPRAAREVRFRFSIDGAENEFPPGTEHTIYLRPVHGRLTTRVYTFGDESEPPPTPEESASDEDGTAQVTFRVDLRAVKRALDASGVYRPRLGAPIRRGELAHVYVVGDPALLRPGDEVVDQHADPPLGSGPEVPQVRGEVVDPFEVLDDDALDAQVVAPDLLDELGIVDPLDQDAARPRHLRLRP